MTAIATGPSEPFTSPAAAKPEGWRDTIESIVIAFIFAFVFRAFLVEAFVIPTGSMAPTLYGLHGQHRCPACKFAYAYGLREDTGPQNGGIKPDSLPCPNCGYDGEGNRKEDAAAPYDGDAGDRILVLKWPYDVGGSLLGPQRWDVVVFKDPQDGEQNFIKRLIGLPGEVLEIIDGDIYTCPQTELSAELRDELSKPRAPIISSPNDPRYQHLTDAHYHELNQKLRIARKTRVAQESLWLIHYDHDYPPDPTFVRGSANPAWDPPRWSSKGLGGTSPWKTDAPQIAFSPADHAEHAIKLEGQPVGDRYGYDAPTGNNKESVMPVGDVRLKFVLTPRGRDGSLALTIARGEDEFRASIHADGQVELERIGRDGVPRTLTSGKIAALEPGKIVELEYANLDYRVALKVDDAEVVATTDKNYKPDLTRIRRECTTDPEGRSKSPVRVEIAARDLPLELRHVAVHRDVYYRSSYFKLQLNPRQYQEVVDGISRTVIRTPGPGDAYEGGPGWGTTNYPILLRANPGDYFCCGDNSPQSKDSRMWVDVAPVLQERGNYQFGTVPADQMIGRAFFVYWPNGYRVFFSRLGFIPNVGRMRIIR